VLDISLDTTVTIEEIKSKIQSRQGTPVNRQTLLFNGTPLLNGRTVGDYNINNRDTLVLAVSPAEHDAASTIHMDSVSGHTRLEDEEWDTTDATGSVMSAASLALSVVSNAVEQPAEDAVEDLLARWTTVYDVSNGAGPVDGGRGDDGEGDVTEDGRPGDE
jgi:hypothetical protein